MEIYVVLTACLFVRCGARPIQVFFAKTGHDFNNTEVIVLALLLVRLLDFAKVQLWAQAVLVCHTSCASHSVASTVTGLEAQKLNLEFEAMRRRCGGSRRRGGRGAVR
jgi:hypothetical protein